jgi:5-(carboxyamino)imidazole ribonucleotide mutase
MLVGIILGSKSDFPIAKKTIETLKEFDVTFEMTVASAHRTPERVVDFVEKSGANVFIAIAGLSAALPGVVAAHTIKPVIGVPVSGKVNLDSILSIVQMPPGIPVGTVGLDMGENAAILAIEILAVSDKNLKKKLMLHRKKMKDKVVSDAEEITKL